MTVKLPEALTQRLHHFTWAWFTVTMGTGGIAVMLSKVPYSFHGLDTIGDIIFVANLVFFCLINVALWTRFILFPTTLRNSWNHPTESLFIPTFMISVASILLGMTEFAEPHVGYWFVHTQNALFWIYTVVSLLLAVVLYQHIFTAEYHTIHGMTPAWLLPIFPALLVGTVASSFSASQPTNVAVPMIVVGLSCLGLGFLLSSLFYAIYISRLMLSGLPEPVLRPGMFIAVGPPSFLVISLVNMGQAALSNDDFFPSTVSPAAVFNVGCIFVSIFAWSLGLWLVLTALYATLAGVRQLEFHLVWWAMIFPNAAFTLATSALATALNWGSLKGLATAFSLIMVTVWLFVLLSQIRAVLTKRILMPGKDVDKPEGGFYGEFSRNPETEPPQRQQQDRPPGPEQAQRGESHPDNAATASV